MPKTKRKDIWQDPGVVEALKSRRADDIMVLECPKCGQQSYYNQGSTFYCTVCDRSFYALSADEDGEDRGPCVQADDAISLSDTVSGEEVP